ncbi:hypothetical protein OIU84_018574 [Salix udensis]|uniref:Uncharacterized protein n=1 Tax=Salix udensis TaxID=889485 RepID=A0AAD6KX28_9ROSI|nr:hypothetical protein OIU84_018574 [Salix udensis]
MTLSYTLSSSTGNIISPDTRVLHSSHFNPPRNRFSFFSSETSLFKRETFPFKPQQQQPPKSFLPILRLDSSKPAHPFASLSSYAEAGGEEEEERRDSNRETARNGKKEGRCVSWNGSGLRYILKNSLCYINIDSICCSQCSLMYEDFGDGSGLERPSSYHM